MNNVTLVGRLTKDVDTRTNNDSTVSRFSIAVTRDFKNKDGKYDADFINCVAFGRPSEFISKYFSKGMRIGVTGRIQTGSYTNKDGQKVYTTDVVVEKAEFVENKGESKEAAPETKADDTPFENIPDGINEELPFN